MSDDDVLGLTCPACGDLYGEHSLVGLAWCMEQVYDDDELDVGIMDGQLVLLPAPRQVEVVRDPQGRVR